MTENEKNFVKAFFEHKTNICKTQDYIKENFGINSEYNEDTNTLHLFTTNINESLNLAIAKEYIMNTLDETMINVKYGF